MELTDAERGKPTRGEERRAEEADPALPLPPSTSSGQRDAHMSSLVC